MAINNLLHARRRQEGHSKPPGHVHLSRWPAIFALVALGLLYLSLPDRMTRGPGWLLLAVESPVILFLAVVHRINLPVHPRVLRAASLALLSLATVLVAAAVQLLLAELLAARGVNAKDLLGSAAALWCSNVIVFALWFWELDGGGPHRRHLSEPAQLDFLFPQQSGPGIGPPGWKPLFMDYLFVAFTNATAFSPTDTLPLSKRVKALMMIEALCSLLIVAVLAARAINIL